MKLVKKLFCLLMFSAALSLPGALSAQQKTGFKVLASYPIKSSGGWDYITVDGAAKLVYTSHGNQVNVLSTTTGDSVGVIAGTKGVHGIALVKELNKGYTSNGWANTVSVFDLKTNQVSKSIPVGANPDAIFYDDYSKKIYAFNGRSKDASVIDVTTGAVVATIPLGGKPETGVSDGKGKVFVNIEDTNEEVVIDAKTYKILNRWKLVGGDEPSGLAIDRKTNRLFIGCGGSKTMIVLNTITGKTVVQFPIGACDGVAFDSILKQVYSSNGEGSISVIRELSADKFVFVENIITEPGARTIGLDEVTHKLYLPTAKSIPATPTADNPHPWPKQIPGTFHIIVVGE